MSLFRFTFSNIIESIFFALFALSFFSNYAVYLICHKFLKLMWFDWQIGSRITSKRVGMFLETSFPSSYILIDRHPCRHDPSHVVTHRIQANVAEFAARLCRCTFQRKRSRWTEFLTILNSVV
jgi:2-succinyl-5-enolpyruvyl-6-hydroxy-3-cyclohexene-1-carboxylate synthase